MAGRTKGLIFGMPWWAAIMAGLCAAIFVSLVIGRSIYRPYRAPSGSMQPHLYPGDYFLSNKLAYLKASPQRGDVVTFKFDDKSWVKRIVGIPGDRVRMVDGRLELNGNLVPLSCDEAVVRIDRAGQGVRCRERISADASYDVFDRHPYAELDNTETFTVPAAQYFVIGDDRDNSADSRVMGLIGYVPAGSIEGRVDVIAPLGARPN